MTRSLPATIALPPSGASMLATRMNLSTSAAVCGSRSTKHFWLTRMVVRMTSLGIEDDLGPGELIDIVVEAPHLDRGGREEAMPARGAAGRDALDLERHHL